MMERISDTAKKYRTQGYKVSNLWLVDRRIESSFDVLNQYGGLEAGRLDIQWAYWNDPKIIPFKWVLYKKSGQGGLDEYIECDSIQTVASKLGAINEVSFRNDGLTLEFKEHEDQQIKGFKMLEMVYIDNSDEWIKLNPEPINNHTTQLLPIVPNVDFDLLIRDQSTKLIYNYEVDATIPYPLHQLQFDFGKHSVTFNNNNGIFVTAVMQLPMADIWIRYYK